MQARIGALKEGSRARLDLELELSRKIEAERIRIAERGEQDITAIRIAGALERQAKILEFAEEENRRRRDLAAELGGSESDKEIALIDARLTKLREFSKEATRLVRERIKEEAEQEAQSIGDKQAADKAKIDSIENMTLVAIEAAKQRLIADLRADQVSEQEIAKRTESFEAQKNRARQDADEQRETIEKTAANRVIGLEARTAAALAQIAKGQKDATVGAYIQAGQAISGVLTSIFGESKSAAIAGAIIDTAAAVVSSFKNAGGWPWGLIPAAAMAAAGLAQIRTIQQTDIGSGQGGSVSVGSGGGSAATPQSREEQRPSFIASGSAGVLPSFQAGGDVPGPRSRPVLAVLHGEERVLAAPQATEFRREGLRAAAVMDAMAEMPGRVSAPQGGAGPTYNQSVTFRGLNVMSDIKRGLSELARAQRRFERPRRMK